MTRGCLLIGKTSLIVSCGMARLTNPNWHRSPIVAVAAAIALSCASCGGSGPSATRHATTTTTASSTTASSTTTTDPETASVLAAYRAEQAAFGQAFLTANAYLPALAATMVNPQLQLVRRNLLGEQHAGMLGEGQVTLAPHVTSIKGTRAVVEDCLYSTQELVYASTRKPVPPVTPPEHDGVRSMLAEISTGVWKVSRQIVTEGHCPAGY